MTRRETIEAIADKLHRDTCWRGPWCPDTTSEDWNHAEALHALLDTMGPGRA